MLSLNIQPDKIKHFLVCIAVSSIFASFFAAIKQPWYGCVIGGFLCSVCIGIGKEFGDMQAPNNKWDWHDILANTLGGIIGSLAGLLALLY